MIMAQIVNPDGSITVGIIPKAEPKPEKVSAPAGEKKPVKKAGKKTRE